MSEPIRLEDTEIRDGKRFHRQSRRRVYVIQDLAPGSRAAGRRRAKEARRKFTAEKLAAVVTEEREKRTAARGRDLERLLQKTGRPA